jgi:hypothetical protein
MNEKHKEFYEKLDAQLDEWGAQIDHLKARSATAKANFLTDYGQSLEAFQRKHAEALAKLKELRAAGDEAWDDLVAGLEQVLADGKTAYHTALARFKSQD